MLSPSRRQSNEPGGRETPWRVGQPGQSPDQEAEVPRRGVPVDDVTGGSIGDDDVGPLVSLG